MRKPISAALMLTLALAACSNETAPPAASAAATASAASAAAADVCRNTTLVADIRTGLQTAIAQAAQTAAGRSRGMVDAAKLSAAAARLDVRTDPPQAQDGNCQTLARISIPADMLRDAERYAPLLNSKMPATVFAEAQLSFNGSEIEIPLRFTTDAGGKTTFDPAALQTPAQVLTDALLAFAVKDTLMQGGQTLGRDEALRRLSQPLPAATASAVAEVPPLASEIPDPPLPGELTASAPEILKPDAPQSRIQAQELENARQANEEAGSSIRSAWQSIDPAIQQSLLDEQKNWESKKQQSCRNAGAKGADKVEAQYLQIQCDTRLTRERIQYLNGYSIK